MPSEQFNLIPTHLLFFKVKVDEEGGRPLGIVVVLEHLCPSQELPVVAAAALGERVAHGVGTREAIAFAETTEKEYWVTHY